MQTKTCSKCKTEKNIQDFYVDKSRKDGYRSRCKVCCNIESSIYQKLNTDVTRKKTKKFRENNPIKVKEIFKKWRNNNILTERKRSNSWKKNNRDKINKYKTEKRQKDYIFKITENVRNRTKVFLMTRNVKKSNKTFKIVGCSPEFLKVYLESLFLEGMSWENYGLQGWHIDHIIPLSSAKSEEEIYKLCHYTNLQPLWKVDNLKKGSKIL